jgi:hypothetical protein
MPASASSRHHASSLGELAVRDAERSAEGVERLAAEDAEDDLGLAAAGPSSLVLAVAFVGAARAPRSLRRRRRLVSWLLHGVVNCALVSQTGVSGNCAAHHIRSDRRATSQLIKLRRRLLVGWECQTKDIRALAEHVGTVLPAIAENRTVRDPMYGHAKDRRRNCLSNRTSRRPSRQTRRTSSSR